MPRLEIRSFDEDPSYRERILALVRRGMVCGFCIFKGRIDRVAEVLAQLQAESQRASLKQLIFSIDAEWGLPMRLEGDVTEFPYALALAHSTLPNAIRDAARATAQELRALGIHWSFAPVADVNSDPENPIINIRSFSEDPRGVSTAASEYAKGLREAGVIACAKHFPGHGETRVDSHRALPVLDLPVEHFEQIEFVPFRKLIADGIPSVMTGHLAAPQLARSLGANTEEAMLPASLSRYLTRTLLRERFGFGGVIITDSMEMGGLKGLFSTDASAAETAIMAGNDIVLMSPEPEAVHAALCNRYATDAEFAMYVDAAATRVDRLLDRINFDLPPAAPMLRDHAALADSIAKSAIESVGDTSGLSTLRFACIVADDPLLQRAHVELLERELRNRFPDIHLVSMRDISVEMADELAVFVLERPRGRLLDQPGKEQSESPVGHLRKFVQKLQIDPKCIFFLGNPYLVRVFEPREGNCRVFTYSDSAPSISAVIMWLQSKR